MLEKNDSGKKRCKKEYKEIIKKEVKKEKKRRKHLKKKKNILWAVTEVKKEKILQVEKEC